VSYAKGFSRRTLLSARGDRGRVGAIAAKTGIGVSIFGQRVGLGATTDASKTVMERRLENVRSKTGEPETETMEDIRAFAAECARSESLGKISASSLKESESAAGEYRRENQHAE